MFEFMDTTEAYVAISTGCLMLLLWFAMREIKEYANRLHHDVRELTAQQYETNTRIQRLQWKLQPEVFEAGDISIHDAHCDSLVGTCECDFDCTPACHATCPNKDDGEFDDYVDHSNSDIKGTKYDEPREENRTTARTDASYR